MFGFVKKVLFTAMAFFGFSPSNVNSLECVSMSNQECKARPKIIEVNSCNNINDPYDKLCVPDIVKNINLRLFNLMQRINERRHVIWHETCKCICRLTANACNNKQRFNEGTCRCEYKELIDNGICDKGFIWNCVCRNSIVDKLVEERTKVVEGDKIYNET